MTTSSAVNSWVPPSAALGSSSSWRRSRFVVPTRRRWGSCGVERKIVCACTAPPRNLGDERSAIDNNNNSPISENLGAAQATKDESDILVECRNVHKSFGEKQILKGVSFKIRHGEAVGIIGPSGTGKSTILKIMAGLLAPDKDKVLIC